MKMKKELKKKWVEALRSGKYKQGRKKLRTRTGSMCCLGVLCDVMGAKWVPSNEGAGGMSYEAAVFDNTPYASLVYGDGYIIDGSEEIGIHQDDLTILMKMNDREKKTFKQIANYIEKNL